MFWCCFFLVDSSKATKSSECPKLVHKPVRKSFERKHYTPVRLEKKFDECLQLLEYNGKATNLQDKYNQHQ